jgi:hypothetical protein
MEARETAIAEALKIARLIIKLKDNTGFKHFAKAIQNIIDTETPKPTSIANTDEAIRLSSKLAHINGLRRVLGIIDSAQETIAKYGK